MTEEKTCYNCGNKNCNVYYSMVKKNYKRHFETYEYKDFDCVNHDKWEELKIEENEAGAEFGYNKANEWQYPSKGELPKCDEETQLMFYVNCYYNLGDKTVTRKRMVLGYYKKSFLSDDVKLFVEKSRGYEDEHLPQAVIAWKEIVLPKESE